MSEDGWIEVKKKVKQSKPKAEPVVETKLETKQESEKDVTLEYVMNWEKCPQCIDNQWFIRVGVNQYRQEMHEQALKKANEDAKTWADSDEGKCSLSWYELWVHHFTKAYSATFQKIRRDKISEYETECYKKRYG